MLLLGSNNGMSSSSSTASIGLSPVRPIPWLSALVALRNEVHESLEVKSSQADNLKGPGTTATRAPHACWAAPNNLQVYRLPSSAFLLRCSLSQCPFPTLVVGLWTPSR
jgi:hypothetical protein